MTTDLGLRIIWRVDDEGRYTATWHVPGERAAGSYRFVITANRYRIASGRSRWGVRRRATAGPTPAAARGVRLSDTSPERRP